MEEKTRKFLEQLEREWNEKTPEEKKQIEKNNLEGKIQELKKHKFELKKWTPPKYNPNWSHDHCCFCHETISEHPDAQNEGYVSEDECDWVCKKCFEKYLLNK